MLKVTYLMFNIQRTLLGFLCFMVHLMFQVKFQKVKTQNLLFNVQYLLLNFKVLHSYI